MPKPQPLFDLTTVEAFQAWLKIDNPSEQEAQNIQACITAASAYWLWRTGNGSEDGSIPMTGTPPAPASPFVKPIAFDEFYDGNGSVRMFIRHTPIVSIQALMVNGLTLQPSARVGSPGYVIDQSKASIAIRGGGGSSGSYTSTCFPSGLSGAYFAKGIQNVEVQYTAGFNGVPFDIEMACRQMVAVNYKRRAWIDQASQSLAQGGGTVTYRSWEVPPEVESVMLAHTRMAAV